MSVPAPFLNLRQVRRNFLRAASSYDAVAVLQREIDSRMLERLDYMKIEPARVLDLGVWNRGQPDCAKRALFESAGARYRPESSYVADCARETHAPGVATSIFALKKIHAAGRRCRCFAN